MLEPPLLLLLPAALLLCDIADPLLAIHYI
jgi:hypothetical protein